MHSDLVHKKYGQIDEAPIRDGFENIVGVYIWICVLDYLNKTQDSRSFGAKPPCQDLMKI